MGPTLCATGCTYSEPPLGTCTTADGGEPARDATVTHGGRGFATALAHGMEGTKDAYPFSTMKASTNGGGLESI